MTIKIKFRFIFAEKAYEPDFLKKGVVLSSAIKKLVDHPVILTFGNDLLKGPKVEAPMVSYLEKVLAVTVEEVPVAEGHMVVFEAHRDGREVLKGTAKVLEIVIEGAHKHVSLRIIQTDESSLEEFETIFNERQANVNDWIKEVKDE